MGKNSDNGNRKRNRRGQAIVEGTSMIVVMVGLSVLLLIMIVNTGLIITTQQRENLVAYNAVEEIARRTYWLGLERGAQSPQRETMTFIKNSTSSQGLPGPNVDGFEFSRTGPGGRVFSVTFTYNSPLIGNLDCFGHFRKMKATGTYIRSDEGAPLVLRVVRANGTSILIPAFGLNGPTAVGKFTEPAKRFDGYFFWNTGQQQIESEQKPIAMQGAQ
jgi:hypothetical protein